MGITDIRSRGAPNLQPRLIRARGAPNMQPWLIIALDDPYLQPWLIRARGATQICSRGSLEHAAIHIFCRGLSNTWRFTSAAVAHQNTWRSKYAAAADQSTWCSTSAIVAHESTRRFKSAASSMLQPRAAGPVRVAACRHSCRSCSRRCTRRCTVTPCLQQHRV